jgi:hypothetical protein
VEGLIATFLMETLELGQIELAEVGGSGCHLSLAFSTRCEHPIVARKQHRGISDANSSLEIVPAVISVATAKARVL